MNAIMTSVRRTPYQSLAGFLVLFFSLFLSSTLVISIIFLYSLIGYVETRPQVTIYFLNTATDQDISNIKTELMNTGKVASVKYISKQEAFSIYKDMNKNNPLLLEMVSADVLPPSLEVYAVKPEYLQDIANMVQKQSGIDEVRYQKNTVDQLLTFTNIVRKTAFILTLYLFITSVLVLTTTTMFKVALKKEEIELLRLLGASRFFIRKPFLQEAIFFGLAASGVSFMILGGIFLYFFPFISAYLSGITHLGFSVSQLTITIWPFSNWILLGVFLGNSLYACLISVIATILATNKYLK